MERKVAFRGWSVTNRRVARGLQLASLLALYALFAIGYSLLVPLWEAPDETTHYLVVEHVARHGEMPPFEVSYEAMQPPGYYWLAGALLRFLEGVDPQLTARTRPALTPQSSYTRYDWTAQNYRFMWGLQMLRWFNAALGAIALFFIHQGSRELLAVKENGSASTSIGPSPLAVAALVALTPQFLHNATSVSNDALANACGALLFWLLVQSALRPPGARRLALAALTATVLPFLIKLTILPTSAALLLVLAWRAWRARRRLFVTTVATSSAALAAGMVLVAPASALL
ncbi:MAG TPA: hypothetical protein VE553_03795 [Candidatus Binatia bacterium]|nr:hypothetical protein [Candidatus Binatia bacterium]